MGRPKGGKNRKWTYEDRAYVISIYLDEHLSMAQIAIKEDIQLGTVRGWIYRFFEKGEEGLVNQKKTGNQFAALHSSKSLTEVERLELEILRRDIEIERLKKGYLVKGVGANKEFVNSKDWNMK